MSRIESVTDDSWLFALWVNHHNHHPDYSHDKFCYPPLIETNQIVHHESDWMQHPVLLLSSHLMLFCILYFISPASGNTTCENKWIVNETCMWNNWKLVLEGCDGQAPDVRMRVETLWMNVLTVGGVSIIKELKHLKSNDWNNQNNSLGGFKQNKHSTLQCSWSSWCSLIHVQ